MILSGALSPTRLPPKPSSHGDAEERPQAFSQSPEPSPVRQSTETAALPVSSTRESNEFGESAPEFQCQEQPSAPSSTFDSGLGLFASIAVDSEPLALEIHELRRALAEKETEIQSKNLLLVRSKEALLELNERLSESKALVKKLEVEKESVCAELNTAKQTNVDHEQRIDSLTSSLQDALDNSSRTLADARVEWEAEAQQISDANRTLSQKLETSELKTASLEAKICVVEASANEREIALRRQIAEEKERTAIKKSQTDKEIAILKLKLQEANEKLEGERSSREKLAERVAVTEDAVLEEMKKKEAEVEALQIRVDSQQKYLRRFASPALQPSVTPTSSTGSSRKSGGRKSRSSSMRRGRVCGGRSTSRAKRQLTISKKSFVDKENVEPPPRGQLKSRDSVIEEFPAKSKTGKQKSAVLGLTLRGDAKVMKVKRKKKVLKRKGRQVASRYLSSMR